MEQGQARNQKATLLPIIVGADNGIIWNLPQFDKANEAYKCADNWAKKDNKYIFNATPESKLDFFPKVSYNALFPIRNEIEKLYNQTD